MSVRIALFASVCTALLAAPAAVSGALAASPTPPGELAAEAYKSLNAGNPREAVARYSEAIGSGGLEPETLAGALLNRGLAYQQLGQYQDAIDDYSTALRGEYLTAKLRATSLYNRGLAYQKARRPELAVEDFSSALVIDSEFSHAYYSRGNALREAGQYLFALSDYDKALRYRHPAPHLVHYGAALTYEALKQPQEAAKALSRALAAKPDFEAARKRLAALGAPVPEAPKPVADNTVTGSLAANIPDQVVRKPALPTALAPPPSLIGTPAILKAVATGTAAPGKFKKVYFDRIAPTEDVAMAVLEKKAEKPRPALKKAEAPPKPKPAPAAEAEPAPEPVEQAAAPATDESETAEAKGWSIQLYSAKEQKLAWGTWSKLKARHKMLAELSPVVIKADLGAKGIYYRLRLAGYDDRNEAKSLCQKLKSRGLSCFVSRVSS